MDQCGVLSARAGEAFGKSLMVQAFMQDEMAKAGFTNIVKTTYKWPIGAWSNDSRLKELGKWNMLCWQQGLEGWTLRFFTKHMGVGDPPDHIRSQSTGLYQSIQTQLTSTVDA